MKGDVGDIDDGNSYQATDGRSRGGRLALWIALPVGGLVFLFYLLADWGGLISDANVWPGRWIYAALGGIEVGALFVIAGLTVIRRTRRGTMLRNLVIGIWLLNLGSLAFSMTGFYGFM